MFENMSIEFMNLKTVLLEEDLVRKSAKFLFNSSAWLSYMAVGAEPRVFANDSSVITQLDNLDRLRRKSNDEFNTAVLACIPEYFLTNIVDFVIFLNRFKDSSLSNELLAVVDNSPSSSASRPDFLNSFVSLVLTFMGRADRAFNPHARASLAEALECLVPKRQHQQGLFSSNSRPLVAFAAFVKHPCAAYMSEALLNVFVSIEMTGQSVQFEQKFNYRRPMYELIDYLWNLPKNFDDYPMAAAADENVDMALLEQHRRRLKVNIYFRFFYFVLFVN